MLRTRRSFEGRNQGAFERAQCGAPRSARKNFPERVASSTDTNSCGVPVERSYAVVLEPEREAGGFSVSVPALPEIATQGETVEDALSNAKDAIELVLSDRTTRGEEIPDSDTDARIERIAVAI